MKKFCNTTHTHTQIQLFVFFGLLPLSSLSSTFFPRGGEGVLRWVNLYFFKSFLFLKGGNAPYQGSYFPQSCMCVYTVYIWDQQEIISRTRNNPWGPRVNIKSWDEVCRENLLFFLFFFTRRLQTKHLKHGIIRLWNEFLHRPGVFFFFFIF